MESGYHGKFCHPTSLSFFLSLPSLSLFPSFLLSLSLLLDWIKSHPFQSVQSTSYHLPMDYKSYSKSCSFTLTYIFWLQDYFFKNWKKLVLKGKDDSSQDQRFWFKYSEFQGRKEERGEDIEERNEESNEKERKHREREREREGEGERLARKWLECNYYLTRFQPVARFVTENFSLPFSLFLFLSFFLPLFLSLCLSLSLWKKWKKKISEVVPCTYSSWTSWSN